MVWVVRVVKMVGLVEVVWRFGWLGQDGEVWVVGADGEVWVVGADGEVRVVWIDGMDGKNLEFRSP